MQTQEVKQKVEIKKANESDFDSLISLINALADYEKLPRPNKDAQNRLKKDALGENLKFDPWIAYVDEIPAGYAITLFTYSSFLALPTLYIEDIFVLPEYRSQGIGKALFMHCAKIALEKDCGRMEFQVLDWNKIAIDFYEKLGAKHMKEWLPYRFMREDLEKIVKDQETV